MTDQEKTREQLLQELTEVRAQLSVAQDRNNELVQLCDELEDELALCDIVAESIGVGISILNLKTGQITLNEGWLNYLGYSLDEIVNLGAGANELIHENDRERVSAEFLKCVNGDQDHFEDEYQVRRAAGDFIWVGAQCWVLETDPDGKPCSIATVEFDNRDSKYLKKCQALLTSRNQAIRNVFASMCEATPDTAVVAETLYESEGMTALDFRMRMLCLALHFGAKTRRELGQGQFYVKDDAFRYVYVSPEMTRSFGMVSSDFFGRTDGEIFGIDEGCKEEELVRRIEAEESVWFRFSRVRDGKPTIFTDLLIPLLDKTQPRPIWILGFPRESNLKPDLELTDAMPYPSKVEQEVLEKARKAAQTDCTVLLIGESGSGKDHLARYIHNHSPRAERPYFSVNCATVVESLAESELFGHEKGAFTGAANRKRGKLELAEGGTLFLNEIGELSLILQAKLLTFLDTRNFTRVGGEKEISVNVRIIAATNKDLERELEEGRFRRDLFYRINVFQIRVPSLRERPEDIPFLISEILDTLQKELKQPGSAHVDQVDMLKITHHSWPGNIRELHNVLERGMIIRNSTRVPIDLTGPRSSESQQTAGVRVSAQDPQPATTTRRLSKPTSQQILRVYRECIENSGYTRTDVAKVFQRDDSTISKWFKDLDLPAGEGGRTCGGSRDLNALRLLIEEIMR